MAGHPDAAAAGTTERTRAAAEVTAIEADMLIPALSRGQRPLRADALTRTREPIVELLQQLAELAHLPGAELGGPLALISAITSRATA